MEFSPKEQFLIQELKRLKASDSGALSRQDAHVRGELKIRVMREIASCERENARQPIFVFRPRFAFASASVAIFVFVAGAALNLSQDSVPNDALYPVKIAIENARVFLARDPGERALLKTEFAGRRVEEARKLVGANSDPKLVANALERYEANVKVVRETTVSRASATAVAASLSETVEALLAEAEKQLVGDTTAVSPKMSQRFIEAAQVSVAVLSEMAEQIEEEGRAVDTQIPLK